MLVNNAGIAIEKLAVEQTEADWDAVIGANLKGAYFTATEVARRMIARKQEGNIVNIASVLGTGVLKAVSPYAISKAGILQATRALALELAGQNIRVNALAPVIRMVSCATLNGSDMSTLHRGRDMRALIPTISADAKPQGLPEPVTLAKVPYRNHLTSRE